MLSSWSDGPAKRAIVEFVERTVAAVQYPPTSESRCSTTTARCGASSRCRSSSTSSCVASRRCSATTRPRRAPAVEGRRRARRRVVRLPDGRALRGRRHERAHARGRDPGHLRGDQRRGLRGPGRGVHPHDAAPNARPPVRALCLRPHGRAARVPRGQRVLQPHRIGRRPRLHATHQPGHVRHPPETRDRQRRHLRVHQRPPRRHDHPQARGRLPRRRPKKPVRIWNRTGRRPILAAGNSNGDVPMLEFTHHPEHPRCGCSCCTTTPSTSSRTRPAPTKHSNGRPPTDGPSSASRTIGPPSSDRRAPLAPPVRRFDLAWSSIRPGRASLHSARLNCSQRRATGPTPFAADRTCTA